MSSAKLRNISWIEYKNIEAATADVFQDVESIGAESNVNEQAVFDATTERPLRSHCFRAERGLLSPEEMEHKTMNWK